MSSVLCADCLGTCLIGALACRAPVVLLCGVYRGMLLYLGLGNVLAACDSVGLAWCLMHLPAALSLGPGVRQDGPECHQALCVTKHTLSVTRLGSEASPVRTTNIRMPDCRLPCACCLWGVCCVPAGCRPHSIQSLVGAVACDELQPGDFVAAVAGGRAGALLRPGDGSN